MLSVFTLGGIEDSTKTLASGQQIYEGQPLTLNSAGEVIAATSAVAVYGLAKLNSNQYVDYVNSSVNGYASGKMTVVKQTVVKVGPEVFNAVEVTGTSASVTWYPFDTTQTYVPMQPLYVDALGKISNQQVSANSLLGMMNSYDTTNYIMEIDLIV